LFRQLINSVPHRKNYHNTIHCAGSEDGVALRIQSGVWIKPFLLPESAY
jgi:hypothetical protein